MAQVCYHKIRYGNGRNVHFQSIGIPWDLVEWMSVLNTLYLQLQRSAYQPIPEVR